LFNSGMRVFEVNLKYGRKRRRKRRRKNLKC